MASKLSSTQKFFKLIQNKYNSAVDGSKSQKISDEIKAQREILECSICLCLPQKPPIFQCGNGHLFCEKCYREHRKSSEKCPTCRQSLSGM